MFALTNTLAAAGFVPERLEANMLAAVKAAGGAAWYVPDDFLVLGPELVTNGDFSSGTDGWAISSGSTLANVGGELEITANGSTAYPGATQVIQTTVGKMYQVTVKSRRGTSASSTGLAISRYGGSGNFIAAAINASTTTGQYTVFLTSDWAAWNVLPHASGNPAVAGTVYFDDISIREILSAKCWQDNTGTLPSYLSGPVGKVSELVGINSVTQATAANKPTITRIPRKLGPEKALAANYVVGGGGYDNTITGVSASGFTAVAGTTVSRVALNFPTEIGKTYNITARLATPPASGTVQMYSRDQYNGGGATITTTGSMTSGALYNLQFTATSNSSSALWVSSANAQGFVVDSISVREVLEWSYALTFDGSNDSLAAPASIIGSTLTQPYTMIAWGRPASINATRRVVGDNLRQLGIDAAGHTSLLHNTTGSKAGTYTHMAGQPGIIEAAWDGVNVDLRTNGVTDGSGALAAPGGTLYATCIGQGGAGSNFWAGEVGGVVVCPAVMSDAQRLAVRKFAAAQMGLTL